jgi:undecaprenyl diphosphate synthase
LKSDSIQDAHPDLRNLPVHVAIIMDGNGRWARKKLMNRIKGHEHGSNAVREVVTASREIGIRFLTLYAFSTENWERPKSEIKAIMSLLKEFLIKERDELHSKSIRLNVIGQKHKLPSDVLYELDRTLEMTRDNKSMTLNIALSYGAREELTQAIKNILLKIESKEIKPETITEELISGYLYTRGIPDPDLIIRTSGECRLSNFLLWQAAYSEFYFTDTLWPDFTKEEFIHILKNFQTRNRRFGKVLCSTSNDG